PIWGRDLDAADRHALDFTHAGDRAEAVERAHAFLSSELASKAKHWSVRRELNLVLPAAVAAGEVRALSGQLRPESEARDQLAVLQRKRLTNRGEVAPSERVDIPVGVHQAFEQRL